jgi:hypothetical protein
MVGGEFKIETAPGKGTTVSIAVPVNGAWGAELSPADYTTIVPKSKISKKKTLTKSPFELIELRRTFLILSP